jgi:hypothetical protein
MVMPSPPSWRRHGAGGLTTAYLQFGAIATWSSASRPNSHAGRGRTPASFFTAAGRGVLRAVLRAVRMD